MCESNPIDEMTSFEVLNHNEMAESISSEFSIIPEQPPTGEETLMNGNFDDVQSAFMSASQDLSVHEIQSRIVELAKDNAAMKDALEWNNVMMKEQLSTISAWHNQMTTSMSKQQLSLKEAAEKVDDLERENVELKEKLMQLENNSEEIRTQDGKSVQDVASCTEIDPLIVELKLKLEEQKLEDSRRVETVALHLEEAEQTIIELKLKLEEQNLELVALKESAHEKEFLNAAYELRHTENDALKSKCISLEHQLKEYQDKENQDKKGSDSEMQSLKMKICDLETEVLLKEHATEGESIKHGETRKLLGVLQSKYDRVSRLLQVQDRKNPSMCLERSDEEKKYLEQIDNLTAQLFDLEEKLAEREEKANLLTSQLQAVNKDSESIPVLKSQVEVYKLDLNHAKQVKDEADVEIQRLNQMVRDLQARLDADSPLDGDGPSRPRRNWNGKLHAGGARQGTKLYICPVCDFGFSDPQAAQNHANKCLDEAQIR